MNEIRDRATKELRDILTRYGDFMDGYDANGDVLDIDGAQTAILSIPEIAIVDREAKLPNYIGAAIAGTLKDWVREIKDEKL